MFSRVPSSSLRVTGPDRLDFMQGQMTANLKAAPVPGMVLGCFLNHKGQIEFVARMYRRERDIYVHLWEGQAEGLAPRLKKYIVFDDVQLEDTSALLDTVHLHREEDGAALGWQVGGADVQSLPFGEASLLAARVQRGKGTGLDIHFLRRRGAELLPLLGEERPLSDLEEQRIQAGISDVQDRWEGFLPQEVGLERTVSEGKGCYVGQEIMARLQARGNARYELGRLSGVVAPFAPVMQGGKEVGRSGASGQAGALARLRKDLGAGPLTVLGEEVSAAPNMPE